MFEELDPLEGQQRILEEDVLEGPDKPVAGEEAVGNGDDGHLPVPFPSPREEAEPEQRDADGEDTEPRELFELSAQWEQRGHPSDEIVDIVRRHANEKHDRTVAEGHVRDRTRTSRRLVTRTFSDGRSARSIRRRFRDGLVGGVDSGRPGADHLPPECDDEQRPRHRDQAVTGEE